MGAPTDVFVGWFPPDQINQPGKGRQMIDHVQAALDHWAQGDRLSEPCPRAWRESHFVAAIVNAILALESTTRAAAPYGGHADLLSTLPPPPPQQAAPTAPPTAPAAPTDAPPETDPQQASTP
jgi:integrase